MIAVALRGLSERFGTTVYDDLSVAALRSFAQTIHGVPRIFHGNVAVWAEASAHPSAHHDAAQPNYRSVCAVIGLGRTCVLCVYVSVFCVVVW
jgi:hypothetical protein